LAISSFLFSQHHAAGARVLNVRITLIFSEISRISDLLGNPPCNKSSYFNILTLVHGLHYQGAVVNSRSKAVQKRKGEMIMKNKKLLIGAAMLTVLAYGGVVFAQSPVVNIDPNRHGNLSSAQSYIVQAWQMVDQAQEANHDRLGGHAQRAKELLNQADEEIRLAADVANSRGR
jgi:hypothetical protein